MISYSLMPDSAYANLPENPEERFLEFVNIVKPKYLSAVEDDNNIHPPYTKDGWYQQYVHELIAAAESCGISGLIKPDVAIGTQSGDTKFHAALARTITALKMKNWTVGHLDSVAISTATKLDILKDLESLRELVNKSNLSDAMKAGLHKRIDAVEAELGKSRSSLNPIHLLYGAMAFIPASVSTLADFPGAVTSASNYTQAAQEKAKSIYDKVAAEKAIEVRENDRLSNPEVLRIGHEAVKQLTDRRGSTALAAIVEPRR